MRTVATTTVLALICLVLASKGHCVDYGQMVGEWSKAGKCGVSRFVFSKDGKYTWLERKRRSKWTVQYEGIYIPNDTMSKGTKWQGAVIIADGPSQGGNLVRLEIISTTRLKGFWDAEASEGLSFDNPKDALFDYVRCGKR
jgi:hypothetical protein